MNSYSYSPTSEEIAWAAGLFEGEGSAIRTRSGRSQFLSIRMTDREPVVWMHERFGGFFYDAYLEPGTVALGVARGKAYKVKYQWRVSSWRDIIRVATLIRPWLGPRRQAQIDRVLQFQPEFPRGERACPPEPIPSVLGYTRHRRREEPACEVCLASVRLYEAAKRRRNQGAIKATNHTQWLKRKARRSVQG